MKIALLMKDSDNVATCISAISKGEQVTVTASSGTSRVVTAAADIPYGHKIAVQDLRPGDAVRKYAEIIGESTAPIAVGDHVHVHNVGSMRARGEAR
jgi:altronate dehydratase small subunit